MKYSGTKIMSTVSTKSAYPKNFMPFELASAGAPLRLRCASVITGSLDPWLPGTGGKESSSRTIAAGRCCAGFADLLDSAENCVDIYLSNLSCSLIWSTVIIRTTRNMIVATAAP